MPSVNNPIPTVGGAFPRVLFLASTGSQGGIERHAVELAAALRERGVPLQFACPPGSHLDAWCRERGIPTLPFQVRNSGDLGAARQLARLIHAHRVDIVHAHSRRDYVVAVLGVTLARRARLVLHAHMVRPLGEPLRLAGRFFAWGTDAVVAVSEAVRTRLQRDHDLPPALVRLIHNGINLGDFAAPSTPEAPARRADARQNLGIPNDALVLGMVGRLDAKGQSDLLTVAPALIDQCPLLHFVLIGSEGQPGDQARLMVQAEASGLVRHLHFTGPREDVPTLLPALDILVHLPRDESFGLALAEAMAAGLPAVATNIGGCREVVRDGVTGLLVPPSDSLALTKALEWLLDPAEGAARRAAFGEAGRRVVAENFSRERQLDLLQALYSEVCPYPAY